MSIGEDERAFFGHHQVEWPGAISRTATAGPSEANNKKERKGKEEKKKKNLSSPFECVCAQNRIMHTIGRRQRTMKGANQKEVNKPKGANEPPSCNL